MRGGLSIDPARLAAIRELGLRDAPSEKAFDRLSRLASQMIEAPVELILQLEEDRKVSELSGESALRRQRSLAQAFCRYAVVLGDLAASIMTEIDLCQEIRELKLAPVRESEQRFRCSTASLPVGIFFVDERGSCSYANASCRTVLGIEDIRDEDKRLLESWSADTPADRTVSREIRLETPQGIRTVRMCLSPVAGDSGAIIGRAGILEDVTDSLRVEEGLGRHVRQQSALNALSVKAAAGATALMDEAVVLLSQTLDMERSCVLELLPGGDLLLLRAGVGWEEGCVGHATMDARSASIAGHSLLSPEPLVLDNLANEPSAVVPSLLRDRGIVSGISSAIQNQGRVVGILGAHTGRQRTFFEDEVRFVQSASNVLAAALGRAQAGDELRLALKKHQFTVREIHHRVKNDLQIISSVLGIQSAQMKDPQAREAFKGIQNRVQSIAMLHTVAYQSMDVKQASFAEHIRMLVDGLFQSYGVSREMIKPVINLQEFSLDPDALAPCALIVNELVTNVLKHAFPQPAAGELRIDAYIGSDDKIHLIVSDTGVGIPKDIDIRTTPSFGLQLVSTLCDQMGATLELDRTGGASYKIAFPAPQYILSGATRSQAAA